MLSIPTTCPVKIPQSTSDVLILVSKFENRGSSEAEVSRRIVDQLTTSISTNSLQGPSVVIIPTVVQNSQEAVSLGHSCSATFVIWGWYDNYGIQPYFTIAHGHYVDLPTDVVPVSPSSEFTVLLRREIPEQLTYFTLLSLAQVYLLDGDFNASEMALMTSDEFSSSINENQEEITVPMRQRLKSSIEELRKCKSQVKPDTQGGAILLSATVKYPVVSPETKQIISIKVVRDDGHETPVQGACVAGVVPYSNSIGFLTGGLTDQNGLAVMEIEGDLNGSLKTGEFALFSIYALTYDQTATTSITYVLWQ